MSAWHPLPGDLVMPTSQLNERITGQWPPDGRRINPLTGDFDEKLFLCDMIEGDMFMVIYTGHRFEGTERELVLLYEGQLWWLPLM